MRDEGIPTVAQTAFREGFVEVDGFRIRYMEAGQGAPLVHLHGAGGPRVTPAHDLLARHFRVVAFEMPGFGQSPENTRTRSMPELASTMAQAVARLGLDTFNLLGTSFGGKTALWLALQAPSQVLALVLEAPAAIRQEGAESPSGSPEEITKRFGKVELGAGLLDHVGIPRRGSPIGLLIGPVTRRGEHDAHFDGGIDRLHGGDELIGILTRISSAGCPAS